MTCFVGASTYGSFHETSSWHGLGAPKTTPAEIVDKLGGTAPAFSAADFGRLIADDTEKWGKMIEFSAADAG